MKDYLTVLVKSLKKVLDFLKFEDHLSKVEVSKVAEGLQTISEEAQWNPFYTSYQMSSYRKAQRCVIWFRNYLMSCKIISASEIISISFLLSLVCRGRLFGFCGIRQSNHDSIWGLRNSASKPMEVRGRLYTEPRLSEASHSTIKGRYPPGSSSTCQSFIISSHWTTRNNSAWNVDLGKAALWAKR